MSKELILNKIINELFNGSKSDFARKLDVKPQTISSWLSRNTFDLELIYAKCEIISADFLLTGEGSMLKNEPVNTTISGENTQTDSNNSIILSLIQQNGDLREEVGRLKAELERLKAGAGNALNVATA